MKKLIFSFTALALGLSASLLWSDTISTCAPQQSVRVGSYITQTDFWNQSKCPGTQCVDIDDQTGSFTVTQNTPICPDVSSYPSMVYGKAWGQNSELSALPALLNSLTSVISSWDFTPTYTGSWDAAYDVWVCPDNNCGNSGFPGGAEIMIWMDYYNTSGWQYDMGPVTLSGKAWEVWQTDMGGGGNKWKYIAYLSQTPVNSVTNLEINDFLKDGVTRGYLKPDWYLYAVEAGNEMRKDGVPFTSRSFSVSVNPSNPARTVYREVAHPGMPAPVQAVPVNSPSVIQNFLSQNPQAGKTFADALGSTLTYLVKDNPNKPGSKFLAIHFDEIPGGNCGVTYPAQTQDWTGAKAVRFLIYSKVPVVMGFAFKDKNNNTYTAATQVTKGTGWETIQIPLDSFILDSSHASVPGAPLDLSSVQSFTLQPQTAVQTTIGIDSLVIVK
jgi:cellulose 1,4-beta-cellobiosidase